MITLLALLACFQQEPLIQEEYKVQYVLLDVVAIDKRTDKPITDLKATDFVVTENRKKVTIDSFEVLDFSRPRSQAAAEQPAPASPASGGPPPGLTIAQPAPLEQYILAIDLESAGIAEVNKAFSQLDKFLDKLETRENLGVMAYSLTHGGVTDDFISKPEDIKAALANYRDQYIGELDRTRTGTHALRGDRSRFGRGTGQLNRNLEELERKLEQCRSLHDRTRVGGSPEFFQCIDDELAAFVDIQEIRVERAIGELESLTFRFVDTPGPKTILFVSPGFSLYPGQAGIELANLFKGPAGRDPLQGSGDPSLDMMRAQQPNFNNIPSSARSYEDEFRRVAHACIRNRVVFHTFDAFNRDMADQRQLTSGRNLSRAVVNAYRTYIDELNGGLRKLAEESGGRFVTTSSVVGPMLDIVSQPQFIYVLGYQSPPGRDGFRNIKIKCKRRRVELRYRSGYFGE